nr:MAG TPA: hypothetical protein [Caudoviricetes sp.]
MSSSFCFPSIMSAYLCVIGSFLKALRPHRRLSVT